jgi:hypothetical protein
MLKILPKAHAMRYSSNKSFQAYLGIQRNEPFSSVSEVIVLHVKTVPGQANGCYPDVTGTFVLQKGLIIAI